jgi:H+-transporting ATPase
MGVEVKMVTGDALAIATETAKTLGMGTDILDAASLGDSKRIETAGMSKTIEGADGYAQVFPEHKYHIVDVLQRGGHIVGMTGDGVNDAPALKKADCGIAVSGATDAARAAASIVLITPGLSVIIDAIKESRKIFQRMNSYAVYRIAETLRVLLFTSIVILVYNFFPVTAMQIVLLALLNDGAILSIAYDNVRYRNRPEAWNMRVVLGMATVLGVVGPVAAFGMFYLGDRVFHLSHPELQTMMYLTLSVAGHLTIFQARTRGPFWSIRPARVLWLAVLGTQAFATLLAVFGILMTPLNWRYAAFVWGYALVWFVATDRVKLVGYRVLDPSGAAADDGSSLARRRSRADLAAMAASVAPFHTDVDTSPGEPVYHDSSACPYGKEIARDNHVSPGTDGRRRCEWCEAHAAVSPFHTDTDTDDPVFHDLVACPYGQEITRDDHDKAGTDGRRHCEWCESYATKKGDLFARPKETKP